MLSSMLNRLFMKKAIGDGKGDTFFYRYRLIETRFGSAYIHRFVRGDKDRCLHDHPWSFLAIILRGGYYEEMREFNPIRKTYFNHTYFRGPLSILWRPAETAHRIAAIHATKPTMSLVFVGPKRRPWGFFTVNGWTPWKKGEPNPICETR